MLCLSKRVAMHAACGVWTHIGTLLMMSRVCCILDAFCQNISAVFDGIPNFTYMFAIIMIGSFGLCVIIVVSSAV